EKLRDYPLKELIPPLAARIDLTFESNRDEAVILEGLLVASSMRTVYSVPQHRQYLRGGYPSEPFLGEAAARAIYRNCRIEALGGADRTQWTEEAIDKIIAIYKDRIPSAVSGWSKQGLIDKGNRGELVARILCTLAHDISILKNCSFVGRYINDRLSFSQMIPVINFLRALIAKDHIEAVLKARPSNMNGIALEEAFKGAVVHFTQFVKGGDKSTITDEGMYLLFLRAAAIHGYRTMDNTDLVIPVCLPCKDNPNRWCMTAIFIQVNIRVDIDAQKTFEFFTTPITKDHSERPYITIAMELEGLKPEQKKARQPKVQPMSEAIIHETRELQLSPPVAGPLDQVSSPTDVRQNKQKSPSRETHPRHEIFITGCSSQVYNVVGTESYSDLLAPKDMLAEHPRKGTYFDAIMQMKPYWKADSSYGWAEMENGSRLGANMIKHGKDLDDALRVSTQSTAPRISEKV
ncbi:hypothetical protein C0992_010224, partial [Termitomyces sp. T32_za158]